MHVLENEFLSVTIQNKGSELCSIFNKLNGLEYLWQAEPSVWAFHAPNLFPVVGNCLNNQIQIDGIKYPMQRHGFARHSPFVLTDSSANHAVFTLDYSEATLAVYPYKFSFQVAYNLQDTEITITYKVINKDAKTIFFSIGAHPAFNIPFSKGGAYDDYYIEFDQNELLVKNLFDESGFFTGDTEQVYLDNRRLNLSKDLFKDGALVFKEIKSKEVLIRNHQTPSFVSVSFEDFKALGVWAAPDAPFVCIEPWLGYADNAGELKEFSEKDGIQKLETSKVFECSFTIGIN
jgi:galactose mutarotase-like enzyme